MMKTIATALSTTLLLSLVSTTAGTEASLAPPVNDQPDDREILDLLGALAQGPCDSCRADCLLGTCEVCCVGSLEAVCGCDLQGLIPHCTCE